ncbi:uncharacterized protein LOC131226791 isoform X2 [Magnolia sinica]|uniref:uncharacterized protein LOC131226791 isoform X2 n=1 Tax=Magnolia sinica TaxID=86752 RepID=UPI0026598D99|nr:uncharacterized protein LOC131226791 isoform X2 [Magnolia sinica]
MTAVVPLFSSFTPNPISTAKLKLPPNLSSSLNLNSLRRSDYRRFVNFTRAAVVYGRSDGGYDPELRMVLELATDSELYEIKSILFGPSYFSPLLKSLTKRADVDIMHGGVSEGREDFIEHLEARFLFLAADARSTLSEETGSVPFLSDKFTSSNSQGSLEPGLGQWKMRALEALKVGAEELQSLLLKGGGVLTLAKIYQLLARRLSGKMLLEAANYQIKREVLKKGGQVVAINLESRAALLAARQGFSYATSRYLGLRSMMMLLGPMLWGTFLADVVIQMIGTDYARILRAIYAFAQIRLTRTYGWTPVKEHPADYF